MADTATTPPAVWPWLREQFGRPRGATIMSQPIILWPGGAPGAMARPQRISLRSRPSCVDPKERDGRRHRCSPGWRLPASGAA